MESPRKAKGIALASSFRQVSSAQQGRIRPVNKNDLKLGDNPHFTSLLKLENEHMDMPKSFHDEYKMKMGCTMDVCDAVGQNLHFRLFVGGGGVSIWESVPILVKKYGLKENYSVDFFYLRNNKFRMRIFDLNGNEISYGVGSSDTHHAQDLEYPVVNKFEGATSIQQHPPHDSHMNVTGKGVEGANIGEADDNTGSDEDSENRLGIITIGPGEPDDGVDRSGGVYNFHKVMTKSGVSAVKKQTVALPRAYVRKHLRYNWKHVMLHVADNDWAACNLKWSKRAWRKGECSLGGKWYKWVQDHNLKVNDKLYFNPDSTLNNVLHVSIERRT